MGTTETPRRTLLEGTFREDGKRPREEGLGRWNARRGREGQPRAATGSPSAASHRAGDVASALSPRHPRSQNFSLYQIISSGLQASYLSLHLQRSPCPHVSDSRHLVPLPPSPLPLKTAVLIFRLPFVPSEPLLNQLRTQTCSPTGPPELSSPTTSALLGPCSALSPLGA